MSLWKSILQDITTSTNNSTETNLAAAATFTGTADETLGISGIQVFHTADQDCTVYIDQSIDSSFTTATETVIDSFDCLANTACTRTFISVAPYYRMRVTNNGASTTGNIASYTGMTPVINPLPRALTDDDRLKVESTISGRENTSRHVWVNPTNELAISPVYRLVGTSFDNTTKDTNFWTETVVNGSVTQAGGAVTLLTSAAINSSAKYVSVRTARFVPGSAQLFTAGMAMTVAPEAGNTRRIGCYNTTDGFYMEVAGTTFSVGYRKASSDTLVSSGSFNGNYGPSWSPSLSTYYKVQIEFTPLATIWYIDGVRLHAIKTAGLSNTLTLPITMETINTTCSTDMDLICVGAYIARQGELLTNPTSYYHAYGSTAGVTLKQGAGTVHTIIFGGAQNNAVVTISDSTTAATPVLWVYDATGALDQPISVDMGGLPFNDGLRLTISNSASCTIVYE